MHPIKPSHHSTIKEQYGLSIDRLLMVLEIRFSFWRNYRKRAMEGEQLAEYQRMKKENEELQKQMSMMKYQLAELKGKTTQEDHLVSKGHDMTIDSIGVGQSGSAKPNQINPNQSNSLPVVQTPFVPKPPTNTSYLLNQANFRSRRVKNRKKPESRKGQTGMQSGIEAPLGSFKGQQFDHSGPYTAYPPYYPYPPLPPTNSYGN